MSALVAPAADAQQPTLGVAPVPSADRPAPSSPVVTWTTGTGAPGEVHVTISDGEEALFAAGPSGSQEAPWIQPGARFVFRLYSPRKAGGQALAEVVVDSGRARSMGVSVPQSPPSAPRWTDPVVLGLPLLLGAAIVVLTALHVRERARG